MTKPPTSVRSIRLPDAVWAKLAARAEQTGMSVNALMAAGAAFATTYLVHRSDFDVEAALRPALDQAVAKARVSFGPVRAAPGSRLKKR